VSRNLPLVHAPVPNPLIRWSAVVTGAAADNAITQGLGDWSGMQVFHSLPPDWPSDDPTLAMHVSAPQWIARGQGSYTGVDPQFTATVRALAGGATLVWQAIWLYDPSAPALSSACPPPVCPPCAPCPGGVTAPTTSSGSSTGTLVGLFLFGAAVGGASAYAAGRKS
jgi:hypothetical protein